MLSGVFVFLREHCAVIDLTNQRTSMIIDFSVSPQGDECISMKLPDEGEWILYDTKTIELAFDIMQALACLSVRSLSGPPFGVRESLARHTLRLVDVPFCVGIYVEADAFDELYLKFGRLFRVKEIEERT